MAGLLRPDEVPGLQVLSVGGEMVMENIVRTWADHVTLINIYDPAEASIWCAGKVSVARADGLAEINRPIGCRMFNTQTLRTTISSPQSESRVKSSSRRHYLRQDTSMML